MHFLWLSSILLATSCLARPNPTPPGFLAGNAERPPISRHIDLPKYLQDIQEAVSKAAKDASENVKQHIAAMKEKNMAMIRHQYLQNLASISYIKERLGALRPNLNSRPNFAPCPGCLPIKQSPYQPPKQNQAVLNPCWGNIFICPYAPITISVRPSYISPSAVPHGNNVLKPTVNHLNNIPPVTKFSTESLEHTNPIHHISSTSLPKVVSVTTTNSPLSSQFTLPEKLFNLATNPTTSETSDLPVAQEDLRKNSTIIDNRILELENTNKNQNKPLDDITTTPRTKDEFSVHESNFPKPTEPYWLEPDISTTWKPFYESFTTEKSLVSSSPIFTVDPEEDLRTQTTTRGIDEERTEPLSTYPSNENLIEENIIKDSEPSSTNNINEIDYTKSVFSLSTFSSKETTTESLIFTENLIDSVDVEKQLTTEGTTFETQVTEENKFNTESYEKTISSVTERSETTFPEEYDTTTLGNIFKTDSPATTSETINHNLQNGGLASEKGEETTEYSKSLTEYNLSFSTEASLSVTEIGGKSDQSTLDVSEEISNRNIFEDESTTYMSSDLLEVTTEKRIPETTLSENENYEAKFGPETTEISGESTTDNERNLMSLHFTDSHNVRESNEKLDTTTVSEELTAQIVNKIAINIYNQDVKAVKPEESTIESNFVVDDYSTEESKLALENNTEDVSLPDPLPTPKVSETTTIYKPDELTTATATSENFFENGREGSYDFGENFLETSTQFGGYLEHSTQPFNGDTENIGLTDGDLVSTTDHYEKGYSGIDVRSPDVDEKSTNYQEGVLKFTTELERETKTSLVENTSTPSSASLVVESVLNHAEKFPVGGALPFSTQSVRQCLDLISCLVPKNSKKRKGFPLENSKMDFSKTENNTRVKRMSNFEPKVSSSIPRKSSTATIKEERVNVASTPNFHASSLLELLPVIREGYRNNAFSDDDKKIVGSIFGDMTSSLKVEENVDGSEETSHDMLMKDATSRTEEVVEDEDYDSSEYGDVTLGRGKRLSKTKHMVNSVLRKMYQDNSEGSNKPSSPKRRETRSTPAISEAAAILGLLAEQSDVQLDAPDDEDEDYYEYYEDQGGDDALDHEVADVGQDEDYEEPSFVELIQLARRHNQRRSKQES